MEEAKKKDRSQCFQQKKITNEGFAYFANVNVSAKIFLDREQQL